MIRWVSLSHTHTLKHTPSHEQWASGVRGSEATPMTPSCYAPQSRSAAIQRCEGFEQSKDPIGLDRTSTDRSLSLSLSLYKMHNGSLNDSVTQIIVM